MITLPQKESLINSLLKGNNLAEAIKETKVPKASLYRYFKDFPAFKEECEKAIEVYKERKEDADLEKIRQIIKRR